MKKQNKVYSASDFQGAVSNIAVDDCLWLIDGIYPTKLGEYSKSPLFELQLKQFENDNADIPEGFVDGTGLLRRNRTFFVREGRPLYTELVNMWEALGGDSSDFVMAAAEQYSKTIFKGHVERLSGVDYTKTTRRGTVVSSNRAEFWYPQDYELGTALVDFVYLCNRGVYTPNIVEVKNDPVADKISQLDPEVIARILASKK